MEQILVTMDDTQKAYVKESLSRALQEVKLASLITHRYPKALSS